MYVLGGIKEQPAGSYFAFNIVNDIHAGYQLHFTDTTKTCFSYSQTILTTNIISLFASIVTTPSNMKQLETPLSLVYASYSGTALATTKNFNVAQDSCVSGSITYSVTYDISKNVDVIQTIAASGIFTHNGVIIDQSCTLPMRVTTSDTYTLDIISPVTPFPAWFTASADFKDLTFSNYNPTADTVVNV